MNEITECTFPDHGSPAAQRACCRPKIEREVELISPASATSLAFWRNGQTWKVASRNTLTCLIGCMIGDIGMIVFLQHFYPHTPMWLTMTLAMIAGLTTSVLFESILLRIKENFPWQKAMTMAVSMSFLSMLAMEIAANATDWLLTGGRVPMHKPFYWGALAISIVAGFVVPLPYNYYKFQKHGKACH